MDSNDGESGGNVGTSAEVSSGAEPGGLQRVFFCYQCQRRTFPDAEHIEVSTIRIASDSEIRCYKDHKNSLGRTSPA